MTFFDDKSKTSFGPTLSWTFSYSLLSLSLACKYAQKYVHLYTCCCWHLGCLPKYSDEVKGKCPIVYEDSFSETITSFIMAFIWLFFSLFWCNFSGPQQTTCVLELKTELRFTARPHVVVMHATLPAIAVLLTVYYFRLCWYIQSIYSWSSSVYFDNLSCIKGSYAQLSIFWSLLFRRTGNGLLKCYGYS